MPRLHAEAALVTACLAMGACTRPAPPRLAPQPATDARAADVVRRHLARLDGLASLSLRVERQTTHRGTTRTERWTFHQKGLRRFRIDYEFPVARLIVASETELWEYIPVARKAARTDLAALSPEQREATLRGVLSRVAMQGLRFSRPGGDTELRYRGLETVAGRPAHCVECRGLVEGKPRRIRGWIDAERLVLLRCEFEGERGQVLAKTEGEGVFEAAPGLWLPRRLTLKRLGDGVTQATTFKRVEVDRAMPDSLFTFRLPDGVELVEPAGR